jgi:hypothetical protein
MSNGASEFGITSFISIAGSAHAAAKTRTNARFI